MTRNPVYPKHAVETEMQGVCSISTRPMTTFAGTGDPHAYSIATQLVPTHETAWSAVVLQHGSSFPCTASAAPKQPVMWHNISSASSPSYTPRAMLQNVKGTFSSQCFTSSAARGQGTGSNAISGSASLPSQTHASAEVAESQRRGNSCHWLPGKP